MMLDFVSLQDPSVKSMPEASVLCLGNFDGVHIAHRALLKSALCLRDSVAPDALCGVFCFRDLSSDFLTNKSPEHLCSEADKISRFREEGMDFVVFADFPSIRDLSPELFVGNILIDQCHCVGAVCGFNYRFGKYAAGNVDTLRLLLNAPLVVQSEINMEGDTVSSTLIRKLISDGKMEAAAKLLGTPYCFSAPVLHGKKLGRKLGFPTINQMFPLKMLIPPHGVYITDCIVDGKTYRGVSNVGVHPTVDHDAQVNCETFLLNFSDDIYQKEVKISFLKFLRSEQKFQSIDELCEQIRADIKAASEF
jgi:riboflavin kinase/FMN adenylyltransferase